MGSCSRLFSICEHIYTIDIIVSKFFPLCFEMVESLDNLDSILGDWEKDTVRKSHVEALNRYEKQEEPGK